MAFKLFWNTVDPLLASSFAKLMKAKELASFRLVGGTALSLYRGHRKSMDIDLFTGAPYDSIDFDLIDAYLRNDFAYVDTFDFKGVGLGRPYFIGSSKYEAFKLDLFYSEPFIRPMVEIDNLRIANVSDIVAMKIQVICTGARKKDFWDLHEELDHFTIPEMIALHAERYPDDHDEQKIRAGLINFSIADDDFEPICLKGKYWELIKLDFMEALGQPFKSI
jgi:hypothetical protein